MALPRPDTSHHYRFRRYSPTRSCGSRLRRVWPAMSGEPSSPQLPRRNFVSSKTVQIQIVSIQRADLIDYVRVQGVDCAAVSCDIKSGEFKIGEFQVVVAQPHNVSV